MESSFEFDGSWWLPENPDHKIVGKASFTPGEIVKLDLIGIFDHPGLKSPISLESPNLDLILGLTTDGKPITLHRCLSAGKRISFSGGSTSSFIAHFAYVGVHFHSVNEICFKKISVVFHNLGDWIGKSGFDVKHVGSTIDLKYQKPTAVSLGVPGCSLKFTTIGPGFEMERYNHVRITQKAAIEIVSEKESLDEYLVIIRHLQNFLTLAMAKPTYPCELNGITEANKEIMEDGEAFYHPVTIYYPVAGWPTHLKKVNYFEMLFTLPNVEHEIEKLLSSWFGQADRIQPVYDLYFSTLYDPGPYSEFRFLALAQAVETYHRRMMGGKYQPDEIYLADLYRSLLAAIPDEIDISFRRSLVNGKLKYANEYSLRKRLHELLRRLSGYEFLNFVKDKKSGCQFVDQVVDTRNYLTHYSDDLKDDAVRDGAGLHWLAVKLRLILEICLLEDIGFSREKVTEIMSNSRNLRQVNELIS